MKPEEAISSIKNNMPTRGTYTILTDGLNLAIQALEKQVPVKPMSEITEIRGLQHICSSCWGFIGYLHNYCENCGQAIDWEVGE